MCHHVTTVGNVAFSAAVSDDRSFQSDEIVKYDNVFTNIGNAYNKDTGIFTAPKTGLYVFHIHGLSTPNHGFWFTLHLNDVPLHRAHGRSSDNHTSGGNSIVLSVKSREIVYVKTHYPSTVHGSGLNRYTTFTGYLVAEGTDEKTTCQDAWNSIALGVTSGETVYVKVFSPSSVHGSGVNRYVTFSGYLVPAGIDE